MYNFFCFVFVMHFNVYLSFFILFFKIHSDLLSIYFGLVTFLALFQFRGRGCNLIDFQPSMAMVYCLYVIAFITQYVVSFEPHLLNIFHCAGCKSLS